MRKYINEAPQSVDTSKYKNIDFKDRVVGSSTPSKDKINPSLLTDIDKAAGIAGTKGSVTTAVTGHKKGTRHESGLAVDIAMFDGKGYRSIEDAKKKGIYDKIEKFVKALEGMGYKINSESGNDKAVLWFGFPNHHHHVHISRKSDSGGSTPSPSTTTKTDTDKTDKDETDKDETDTDDTTDPTSGTTQSKTKSKLSMFDLLGGGALTSWLDAYVPMKKKSETKTTTDQKSEPEDEKKAQVNEEIDRIKDLMKKIL